MRNRVGGQDNAMLSGMREEMVQMSDDLILRTGSCTGKSTERNADLLLVCDVCESSLNVYYREDDNIVSSPKDRQSNFDLLWRSGRRGDKLCSASRGVTITSKQEIMTLPR